MPEHVRRARTIALSLVALFTMPVTSHAAVPSLPDTGLFAPVASQFAARTDRLQRTERQPIAPERIRLLLANGQPDEAARLLDRVAGDSREVAVVRARVRLARQDFAGLDELMARLDAERAATADERSLRFAWRGNPRRRARSAQSGDLHQHGPARERDHGSL